MDRILAQHGPDLAAVIVEPLCQGAAGMRIYSPDYLRRLAAACQRHDVLLIIDEIAVGMGRTGRMFAFEHAGISPDIVCLGKGLSGGYLPLSATVVKTGIFDTFSDTPHDNTFYHGHTFAGNPLACASALETLAIYEEDNIVSHSQQLGEILKEELRPLADLPAVSGLRTLGMIGAFEVRDAAKIRDRLSSRHRVLTRPLGNVLYLMLPLNVEESLVRDTVRAVVAATRA
jgi:adenosylmethionine-8-amino-7-oxononanoate aminotransferase